MATTWVPEKLKGTSLYFQIDNNYEVILSTGVQIKLLHKDAVQARATLRTAPCGNCGIMEIGTPYCFDSTYAPIFLEWIEAFSRRYCKSILQGNDRVGGSAWRLMKTYGKDYQFVTCGRNLNYIYDQNHLTGLYWKNIGEQDYLDVYGFGFISKANALPVFVGRL